ncbi:MAG: glycosyltransferase [Anaerolineales bacterium]|jgi:glycosyltransferase involved in cell wall biosynthesis
MLKIVSIIIPAYNEQCRISSCLDSVLDQSVDPATYEILVVDNHSTDRTAAIAEDKGVRVVREPQKGYVYALRRGVEESFGQFLAFTDADCRVPAYWLSRILDDFAVRPDIVAVGGKLIFSDLNPMLDKITRLILSFTDTLPGGNMAIRREALDWIGGFNPNINLSSDYWVTLKLRAVGRIVIDKSLVVVTSGRRFGGAFSSQLTYPLNIVSLKLFNRPLFFDFPDVREGL